MEILSSPWHRQALADPRHPRQADSPQPGTYRVKGQRAGTWQPLRIWQERRTGRDAPATFAMLSRVQIQPFDLARLWPYAEPISEQDFALLLRDAPHPDIFQTPVRPYP